MLAFETHGTAYERGIEQGKRCRELAPRWIERYFRDFSQRFNAASPDEVIPRFENEIVNLRNSLAKLFPDGYEECRGIAAGLGMDEDKYFAAVFSIELRDWIQCTTVGFRGDGKPIIGKTDDIMEHEVGLNVLETTYPDKGLRHIHFHFAGTIWTVAGMNESGFAMGMNGIPGPTLNQEGLASLTALHTILPVCRNVPDAIEHIHALKLNWFGFSLILADAGGGLALVEKTGLGTVVLAEEAGGFYAHTNHILDADFAAKNPRINRPMRENGMRRLERLRNLMPEAARTENGMKGLLCDRGKSGALCQQGEDGFYTDFAVMFLPAEKRIVYWQPNAKDTDEREIAVSEVFS
jgi:predicted choloylglycine hydrolase